jgi:hypothetical protein
MPRQFQSAPLLQPFSVSGASLISAALLFCGCGSVPPTQGKPPFVITEQDAAEPVLCRLILPQTEPLLITYEMRMVSGAGLVNMFFDSVTSDVLNNAAKADARRQMKPLQGKRLDQSFRMDFTNALFQALQSSPWFKTLRMEFPKKDDRITAKEVKQSAVLKAALFHGLSADASSFVAEADVIYFRKGQNRSPYFPRMFYFSRRMSSETIKKAVDQWAANDGALYREAALEGASEISRMLAEDFLNATSSAHELPPESKITIWDALISRKTEMHGWILHRDGNRVLFREKLSGNIISAVPEPDQSQAAENQ